jgi:beta-mannosidase
MGKWRQVLNDWKFKACEEKEWLPAVVPGCVHTDLLRAGIIADPFYGTNEHDLQWIDKIDWEYRAVFDIQEQLLSASKLELVFDGLDTYADVYINGTHVLSADNMFRSWRADIKPLATAKDNTLLIRFRSPIQEDLPKLEQLGYSLPASNDQSEVGGLGEKRVSIFARKAPYHYGWDWGPRFVTSGIWREVRLEGWSVARITDLFIKQEQVTAAEAQLSAFIEIESEGVFEGVVRLQSDGMAWEQSVSLTAGLNEVQIDATIAEPKLWWSRGLGDAHLYTFKAVLMKGNESVSSQSVRTGLRSVRLIRDKDEKGASFYFELNGVPVFAKGANHIPNDSLMTEVTDERYRHEIFAAVESNMNMLRVWGGGIYELPIFYELCDENGIMVWQDFMFACSMYPGDEAFLQSVRLEAEENVKRLRNHPSIVLWCGNNEIDTAWSHYSEEMGWGWKQQYSPELREKLWADYEKIFHRILPDAVTALAPGADYWPSSPLVSLTGDKEQHSHPLAAEGDIHYWGVWHAVEPFENYNVKIGRFMSEYGFQSFPEYSTVRTFAKEEDLALESKVMRAHQKNGDGNRLIKEYMDIYMSEPKDFPSFLYMSQVLQAEAMKMAIEAHRRKMPYCMGSLYWQMNDCWPVASWAGMDYYGMWKALQYYTRNSFRDTMVSIERSDEGSVNIFAVTDTVESINGTVRARLYDFEGTLLKEQSAAAGCEGNSSTIVLALNEREWLEGRDAAAVVLVAELIQDGGLTDSKTYYFVKTKELQLQPCNVTVTEVEGSEGTRFTAKTDRLAKQVWLTAEQDGIFSDNFFDLVPGEVKTVEFRKRTEGQASGKPSPAGKVEARSMVDFLQ